MMKFRHAHEVAIAGLVCTMLLVFGGEPNWACVMLLVTLVVAW